jgi:hypothetical protein
MSPMIRAVCRDEPSQLLTFGASPPFGSVHAPSSSTVIITRVVDVELAPKA